MRNNVHLAIDITEVNKKKALEASISRRRKKLLKVQLVLERCTREMTEIREEYEARIGKLYAKDNQLDVEIIRYKNILNRMQQVLSYLDAVKEIDTIYSQFFDYIPPNTSDEFFPEDEAFVQNTIQTEQFAATIKKLWKKLLFQFHPDLVTGEKEKRKREQIVKKINNAYKNNNYDELQLIESQWYIEEFQTGTFQQLEYVLIEIENIIQALEKQLKLLKASEWYTWKMLKIKNKRRDIFIDLEKSLLDDIICKTKILDNLKNQIDKNELQ